MRRTTLLIGIAILASPSGATSESFSHRPFLQEQGVDVVTRDVARAWTDRDLLSRPWDTAVIGQTDVYDRFPYVESRWFQAVSDAGWNRILIGEMGGDLTAWSGEGSDFGALEAPRGLTSDAQGRVYVADSGNRRVLVLQSRTEFDRIELTPLYEIGGLDRPWDVAHSDRGTPFDASDDRLYVADTGGSRVVSFDLRDGRAEKVAEIGELGDGPGRFAGPFAIAVGRRDGVASDEIYVADAHTQRLVRLVDRGERMDWDLEEPTGSGIIASLDVDHFGSVYAASPTAGTIDKFTRDLMPVARLAGLREPRAFHVPFVNRTDHRSGVVERLGQGAGVIVEDWTGETGLRLVSIGADVDRLSVAADRDLAADFVLTDRASATLEILDDAGRSVWTRPLGELEAGAQSTAVAATELPLPAGDYTLRVNAASTYSESSGGSAESAFTWNGSTAAAVDRLTLIAAEPNPFRSGTTVRFATPSSVDRHAVAVFDVTGRRVKQLSAGPLAVGTHAVSWDGRDDAGRAVAAGVYLVRVKVADETTTAKLVHLR